MLLRVRIERLRKAVPHGPTKHGQLYNDGEQTKRAYRRVTLYTIFVSSENTHLLRGHVFEKDEYKTGAEWHDWFNRNLRDIHERSVLPGIAIRTHKQWAVARILGWVGDAKSVFKHTAPRKRGNQTKSQRRKSGQNHLRRRHRNSRR